MGRIKAARDSEVHKAAFGRAMEIFELSRAFPVEERDSSADQIRRCSRPVCAHIAEAWRTRLDPAHFLSRPTDAESVAEGTRVRLRFASRCGYLDRAKAIGLDRGYDLLLGRLVTTVSRVDDRTIPTRRRRSASSPLAPSPPPKAPEATDPNLQDGPGR